MGAIALNPTELVGVIGPSLAAVLAPISHLITSDEVIVHATRAKTEPPPLAGIFSRRRTSLILVATSARLIVIELTLTGACSGVVSQLEWGDLLNHRVDGRTLKLSLRNGTSEWFRLPTAEAASAILRVMPLLMGGGRSTARSDRVPVCVECGEVLRVLPFACIGCGHAYLTPSEAARMSLWYPGGGQFMIGRPLLALTLLLIELLLVMLIASFASYTRATGGSVTSALAFGAVALGAVRVASAFAAARGAQKPHPRGDGPLPTPLGLLRRAFTRSEPFIASTPVASDSLSASTPHSPPPVDYGLPAWAFDPPPPPPLPAAPPLAATPHAATPDRTTSTPSFLSLPAYSTIEEARTAAKGGIWAALFVAAMTGVVSLIAMNSPEFEASSGYNAWTLIDAALYLLIAFGISRMSRLAAVAGFSLFLVAKLDQWLAGDFKGALVAILLLAAFGRSIHASFVYRRIRKNAPPQYALDLESNRRPSDFAPVPSIRRSAVDDEIARMYRL